MQPSQFADFNVVRLYQTWHLNCRIISLHCWSHQIHRNLLLLQWKASRQTGKDPKCLITLQFAQTYLSRKSIHILWNTTNSSEHILKMDSEEVTGIWWKSITKKAKSHLGIVVHTCTTAVLEAKAGNFKFKPNLGNVGTLGDSVQKLWKDWGFSSVK